MDNGFTIKTNDQFNPTSMSCFSDKVRMELHVGDLQSSDNRGGSYRLTL